MTHPPADPFTQMAPPQKTPEHRKTFGDYMFDTAVYGGIGYLANAAISLGVTRYAVQMKGTTLSKASKHSEAAFKHLFEFFTKSPEQINKWADLSNNILFLGSGGWLLLVPMKWMEDSKLQVVRQIDSAFGTGPKTQEAYDAQTAYYANQAKQSYGSLVPGRMISYALTISAALPFITETTSVNANLNRFIQKHFGSKLGSLSEPLMVVNGKTTDIPAFVDSLSKETVLAGTAAALHFIASKSIAWGHHKVTQSLPLALPLPALESGAHPGLSVQDVEAQDRLEKPREQALTATA